MGNRAYGQVLKDLTCGRDRHARKTLSLAVRFAVSRWAVLILRQPGLAHPVADALALSQVGWIVARRARAEAGDGESGIEVKPGLNRRLRLVLPAKMRQGGGEIKMRERKISVQLRRNDAAARLPPRPRQAVVWRSRRTSSSDRRSYRKDS